MPKWCELRTYANRENYQKYLETAKKLGIAFLGAVNIEKDVLNEARDGSPSLVCLKEIAPETVSQLRAELGHTDKNVILVVKTNKPELMREAIEDKRVDLLTTLHEKPMPPKLFRLAKENHTHIEICVEPLISSKKDMRRIKNLYIDVANATRYNTPIIATTGADSPEKLRNPRDVASILMSFGVPMRTAVSAVSHYPLSLIRRSIQEE